MKKLYLSLALLALLASLACAGLACRRKKPPEESRTESAAESAADSCEESAGEPEKESSIPFYHSDEETYGIDTPYGELRFPTKWQDLTEVRCEGEAVRFFAETAGGKTQLFCFHFEEAKGFLLGFLSREDREVPVYIESFAFDPDALSEEDYYNCCAMSEDINVIISHLFDEQGLHAEKRESEPESLPDSESESGFESEPEESRGEESVPFYHADGEVFGIETPFALLKYPAEWKERLVLTRTEGSPYRLCFGADTAAGTVPLFCLNFGASEGYLLGSLPLGSTKLPLYIESYSISAEALSQEDYEACCAMCEAVNDIISYLIEEYGLVLDDAGNTGDEDFLRIETPYAVLSYPAKWRERLETAVNADSRYKISFLGKSSAGPQQLFDVFFGEGDGYFLGYIRSQSAQSVPLYIASYEFDAASLGEDEFDLLCAMQEDVNVILEKLTEEYGLSDLPAEQPNDSTYVIETKYAGLEYPKRWKERVSVKITQQGGYRVSFSAELGAGALPLFDLIFEGSEGYLLGLMPYGNTTVELRIVSYDVDRARLSAAEFETFCAMQEDVNVIISKLAENYGLVF